jgi:hypothetical protein
MIGRKKEITMKHQGMGASVLASNRIPHESLCSERRIPCNSVRHTGGIDMTKHMGLLPVLLAAVAALVWGAGIPAGWAQVIEFEEANIFFELNHTDGDLGIHALVDGDAWSQLEIKDPNGNRILLVSNRGRLRRQGLTELFFESDEPSFDELSPAQFFRRFPEGEYTFEGTTLEEEELEGTAQLTHVLPAPPTNIRISDIPAAEDCDAAELPVVSGPVIIRWSPVTASHPDIGQSDPNIEIVGYQVVVEREEPTLLVFSVDLPPSETTVRVPPQFIRLGTEFKLEIIATEASGNRTAVETCFEVEN